MKRFLVFGLLLVAVVCKADIQIPKKVSTAFTSKHADAEDVTWVKAGNNYQASFVHEMAEKVALYSEAGTWIKTKTTLDEESTPECIYTKVFDDFLDAEVSETLLIETPETSVYEVTVKIVVDDENSEINVLKFDSECNLIEE